jgi:hypothetical protein
MTFECYEHKFSSSSVSELTAHNEEKEHTITGTGECSLCGFSTDINFTGKVKQGKVPCLCDQCKESLK